MRPACQARGAAQQLRQAVAEEDVVAQHQCAGIAADERAADDEGLRQAVRRRLHGVAQSDAPLRAVAEQLLEQRLVVRRGDDQDVADAGQHQHAERIVDHRLVVDRQQLLADRACVADSRRVPVPPARTMPFMTPSTVRSQPVAGRRLPAVR